MTRDEQLAAEDLRRRHVLRSCVEREGYPQCMGAAAEHGCTCFEEGLTPAEHDEAVCAAWAHLHQRGHKPCRDCAFRRGSPEMESGQTEKILASDAEFRCHQGMPIDARHGKVELGNFAPDDARRYPVCPGWVAAKLRRGVQR